jgi:hypothetical protein
LLRIKKIRKRITPEVGTLLAGYAADVVSDEIHDDLLISGLAFDDGTSRPVLLSYDLLGLDEDVVREIREKCAAKTGIDENSVILTCTHTHSGPHTRRNDKAELNEEYVKQLVAWSVDAVENSFADMTPVSLYHYSARCDESVNRRLILPDNSCFTVTDDKSMLPLADGITDPELGVLYFLNETDQTPIATFVNYTAHPLTCQTGGASSHKITSDYPASLREYVEKELGGHCVFTNGACGDLHPKGFETGFARTREMGEKIGRQVAEHFFDATRNAEKHLVNDAKIAVRSEFVEVDLREENDKNHSSLYAGKKKVELEIQLLTIGDICFVGVPGEILVEPGLEIKWHSPFKKTFILYNATAYISYIPHANAYLAGGYESETALLAPTASFKIVSTAINAMNAVHPKNKIN